MPSLKVFVVAILGWSLMISGNGVGANPVNSRSDCSIALEFANVRGRSNIYCLTNLVRVDRCESVAIILFQFRYGSVQRWTTLDWCRTCGLIKWHSSTSLRTDRSFRTHWKICITWCSPPGRMTSVLLRITRTLARLLWTVARTGIASLVEAMMMRRYAESVLFTNAFAETSGTHIICRRLLSVDYFSFLENCRL